MFLVADTFVLVVVVEHDTRFEGGGEYIYSLWRSLCR
jgi:hypothetical protein